MAKKKKTQLKPVARGFATTSVPKKVAAPSEKDAPETFIPDARDTPATNPEDDAASENAVISQPADDFDPDKVEEQSLQNLVEKLQEKTEKEISRTVKAVEVDRRFAKTLPRLELDPALAERVINLALESESDEARKPLEEVEDKAIARIGITYGVLRRLGFSEERVEECLRAIHGVDLEEAYEWLYTHYPEEELEPKRGLDSGEPKLTDKGPPTTPRTPAEFLAPSSPSPMVQKAASRLDASTPASVPWTSLLSSASVASISEPSETEQANIKAKILASLEKDEGDSDSDGSGSDEEHPNRQYARLKLRLAEIASAKQTSGPKGYPMHEVQKLRTELEAIKKNYFFDEQEAGDHYRLLSQSNSRSSINKANKKRPPKLQPQPVVLGKVDAEAPLSHDIFDEQENEFAGGLFELLDEMPATETTGDGVTITVRDMSIPKHWSGRTPKALLTESVMKADKYAAISYSLLSGGSRAKRVSLNIRWEARKMEVWRMEDVACHDVGQAEQYIATIALHSLTFPATEGFAAGASAAPGGSQTFFRLLPAVFRDLWDELEEARKFKEDTINRAVWSKLRAIVEPKLRMHDRGNGRDTKTYAELPTAINTTSAEVQTNSTTSEQLMAAFRARQTSRAYQEMLAHRETLPIARYRQEVIQTLESSQVMVLSGETGCGKSTQLPTFLLEDQLSQGKPCKIYCTEPRRISALSLAQRVSRELGDGPNMVGTMSSLVGYSIRLESNTSKNTRLTFVTNGIALRMLEGGSGQGGHGTAFDDITHIIIDEVHERTIESDFLLIVLKSLLQQRSDLKVVLMSATVDADKISTFFGGCPTLHVPGRTFPVDVRYLEDAVELTKWALADNSPYARRVHDKFYKAKSKADWSEDLLPVEDDDFDSSRENVKLEKRYSPETAATINLYDERLVPYDLIIRLLEKICFNDPSYFSYSAAVLVFMPGMGEIRRLNDVLTEHRLFGSSNNFRIYPLHSTLSSEDQSAVFEDPPPGVRKIVIATNIAETGITIPQITCVIDSGKHREMRFDEKRQISRLVETFVAKSNAAQRRGRAGRVQRGLCFHLFTKFRHDTQMVDHPLPEMMRLSLSDLALRIKIMKVKLGSSIEDVLSRAMDPPIAVNVQRAISVLVEVRALTPSEEITPMGRLLSKLPTDVHLGKFLLIATIFRCLDPALTIAAALNSKSPFVSPFGLEQDADRAKLSFRVENSDFLTIHNAFSTWRRASANPGAARKLCRTHYLSHQNLQQIEELRQQFLGYLVDSSFIQADHSFVLELNRARYGRNRNRFITVPAELDINSNNPALINAALAAGLYPKILSVDPVSAQMRTISNNQHVAFHPSSVNFGRRANEFGSYHLVYYTLMHSKKLYVWETGPVDDMAILLLCGESEVKLISNSVFIDRNKIRYQICPKSNIALKILRSQLSSLLSHQLRCRVLSESQVLWKELASIVIGKMKMEEDEQTPMIVPPNKKLL